MAMGTGRSSAAGALFLLLVCFRFEAGRERLAPLPSFVGMHEGCHGQYHAASQRPTTTSSALTGLALFMRRRTYSTPIHLTPGKPTPRAPGSAKQRRAAAGSDAASRTDSRPPYPRLAAVKPSPRITPIVAHNKQPNKETKQLLLLSANIAIGQ